MLLRTFYNEYQLRSGIGEIRGTWPTLLISAPRLFQLSHNIRASVLTSRRLFSPLRSYASGFIFTTSLPPTVVSGALAAVEVLASEEGRQLREVHQGAVAGLRSRLIAAGLPVEICPSHIIPVHVGNPSLSTQVSDELIRRHGHYVQAINYPTVPRGSEKLRIAPTPAHTPQMMDRFVEDLLAVWKEVGLPLNDASHNSCASAGGCSFCTPKAEEECKKPYCPTLAAACC